MTKKSAKLIIGLTLVAILVLPFAALGEDFDWNAPSSIEDRTMGPNYQLPENWESLVEGTKEVSHFNYGAMSYDPATERNGDIFEALTGVKVIHQVVSFDDMAQKIATTLLGRSPNPDMFQIE